MTRSTTPSSPNLNFPFAIASMCQSGQDRKRAVSFFLLPRLPAEPTGKHSLTAAVHA
jgi:hypothetical protein